MIKLKDILFEGNPPSIFVPRRMEDRFERMISLYVRNGSKGDLYLHSLHLTVLPDILKNISVGGNFWCGSNNLTSLQGAPTNVGGSFICSYNKLTTLEGSPTNVGGSFYCNNNELTSLKGGPVEVGVDFDCSYNNLTSLKGAPKSVGRDFYCIDNPVQFTEDQVRAVCNVKGKIFV